MATTVGRIANRAPRATEIVARRLLGERAGRLVSPVVATTALGGRTAGVRMAQAIRVPVATQILDRRVMASVVPTARVTAVRVETAMHVRLATASGVRSPTTVGRSAKVIVRLVTASDVPTRTTGGPSVMASVVPSVIVTIARSGMVHVGRSVIVTGVRSVTVSVARSVTATAAPAVTATRVRPAMAVVRPIRASGVLSGMVTARSGTGSGARSPVELAGRSATVSVPSATASGAPTPAAGTGVRRATESGAPTAEVPTPVRVAATADGVRSAAASPGAAVTAMRLAPPAAPGATGESAADTAAATAGHPVAVTTISGSGPVRDDRPVATTTRASVSREKRTSTTPAWCVRVTTTRRSPTM